MSDTSSRVRKPPTAAQIAAVVSGNALEFYDFLTYAFFAGEIGRTFFPSTDPVASLLATLATFGAGFVMRPVGALVIGRFADRAGRKPAMLLSFGLMGLAVTALALIPSRASIGVTAPILVILCRMTGGFALGGEVGSSTAFLIEAAPPRRRGLYVAFQYWGQDMSVFAAGMIGLILSKTLTAGQLDAVGWRVAFLIGALILPFGLLLRRGLPETHGSDAAAEDADRRPTRITLRPLIILALIMLASGTTVSYVMDYTATYATEILHMKASVGFIATIIVGGAGIVFDLTSGLLSDRFGRKPVMMIPWAVLALVTVPAFTLIARERSTAAVTAMVALLAVSASIAQSATLTSVTELLPKRVRAGSLSLIYAFAISIFGGSAQFTVTWLTKVTHNNLAPAWYMSICVGLGFCAMAFLPESAPLLHRRKVEPADDAALIAAV